MMHYSFLLILLAMFLSSCAPDLGELPKIKTLDDYKTTKILIPFQADWPSEQWWKQYHDPQLDILIDEAIQESPSLNAAQARVGKALGEAQQVGAHLYPDISSETFLGKTKQSYHNGIPADLVPHGWKDYGRSTLNFSYEFDFWGKNKEAVEAATSQVDAAYAEAAQAKIILTTSIVTLYAELAQLYAEKDASLEAVQVRTETAKLFESRKVKGLENIGGLKQAQAAKFSAEADVVALDENITLVKNRIATLLGKGPDIAYRIKRPLINVVKYLGIPNDLHLNFISRRPDIVAAKMRAEAAAKMIHVAHAGYYPNVNLKAFIGVEALGFNSLSKSGSSIGAAGPAIYLPIFKGGQIEGAYRIAHAEYNEAVALYENTIAQALQDVADAMTSQKFLSKRLEKSLEALKSSQEAYLTTKSRYKGGMASYLDVLRTEDALIANRRAVASLKTRAFKLDVALIKALGGGFLKALPKLKD